VRHEHPLGSARAARPHSHYAPRVWREFTDPHNHRQCAFGEIARVPERDGRQLQTREERSLPVLLLRLIPHPTPFSGQQQDGAVSQWTSLVRRHHRTWPDSVNVRAAPVQEKWNAATPPSRSPAVQSTIANRKSEIERSLNWPSKRPINSPANWTFKSTLNRPACSILKWAAHRPAKWPVDWPV
jgi:hypothetical protein